MNWRRQSKHNLMLAVDRNNFILISTYHFTWHIWFWFWHCLQGDLTLIRKATGKSHWAKFQGRTRMILFFLEVARQRINTVSIVWCHNLAFLAALPAINGWRGSKTSLLASLHQPGSSICNGSCILAMLGMPQKNQSSCHDYVKILIMLKCWDLELFVASQCLEISSRKSVDHPKFSPHH